jgi:hypothetical protein
MLAYRYEGKKVIGNERIMSILSYRGWTSTPFNASQSGSFRRSN